jgi:hypothetical protein
MKETALMSWVYHDRSLGYLLDKPNGVRKTDIAPCRGGSGIREETIKEEILRNTKVEG